MEIDDDLFVTVIQSIHCRNAIIPSTWRPAKRMYIIDLLAQIKTLKESEDFTIVSNENNASYPIVGSAFLARY